MSVHKISDMDPNVILRTQHDELQQAQRVILVGGEGITINADIKTPQSQDVRIERIEVPVIVKQTEIRELQIPMIIKEVQVQKVEVPVIIKETQVQIVKTEVVVTKPEIIQIDKPIFIERSKEFPKWAIACMVLQVISSFGLLIAHIVK